MSYHQSLVIRRVGAIISRRQRGPWTTTAKTANNVHRYVASVEGASSSSSRSSFSSLASSSVVVPPPSNRSNVAIRISSHDPSRRRRNVRVFPCRYHFDGCRSLSSSSAFSSPHDDDDGDDTDDPVEPTIASATTTASTYLFDELPGLHPSSLHAITSKLGLRGMTEIQHGTFEAARSGRDVLGRARTGTGKTLAFLLPALESALRSGRVPGPHDEYRGRGEAVGGGGGGGDGGGRRKKGRAIAGVDDDDGILGDDERSTDSSAGTRAGIAILVLSPTRELAMQIHSQAQMLTSSHTNGVDRISNYPMISQVMYGGTSRISDIRKLEDNMPYVLIATPGRLIDHIRTSTVRGTSFAELIRGVSVWVLDEADRCLDMGFRNDMEYILDHKPRGVGVMGGGGRGGGRTRGGDDVPAPAQTLLFSATLPKELRSIMASHMREDYLTVDCVRDVDPTTHTNTNVDQTYVTLPSPFGGNGGGGDDDAGRFISGLVDIIEDVVHVRNPTDYKIVVFFPTTAMCEFFSHVFNAVYRIPVLEIHSKKKQNNRTTTSDKFRKFDRGILFTTDVSARGVDYPNVTHVLQYGSAENRETYIHRLGRTGRAGKVGRGIIICVTPGEERQFVNRELGGLDVRLDDRYQRLLNGEVVIDEGETGGGGVNGFLKRREVNAARLRKILNGIGNGDDELLHRMGNGVYRSLLGYNMTKMSNLGLTRKEEVVAHVNSMAMQMGYREGRMPRMSPKIVQTLGLVGVRGVNVGRDSSDYEDDGVSGRGFDRGAGGSGSSRGRFGDRGRGGGGGQGRGRSRQLR